MKLNPEQYIKHNDSPWKLRFAFWRGELSVKKRYARGKTLLDYAASYNRPQIAEFLLRRGASPITKDSNGSTPMHEACWNGSKETALVFLNHILKKKKPVDYLIGQEHLNCLTLTYRFGFMEFVNRALQSGELDHYYKRNRSSLAHVAVISDDPSLLKKCEQRGLRLDRPLSYHLDKNQYTENSFSALAILYGSMNVLLYLQSRGISCSTAPDNYLEYPLEQGREDVFQFLMKNGYTHRNLKKSGITPLMIYSAFGKLEKVKELCSGSNINLTTRSKRTALMLACCNGHKEVVSHLLKEGAFPIGKDNVKKNTLCYAIQGEDMEIVRMIYTLDPAGVDGGDSMLLAVNNTLVLAGRWETTQCMEFLCDKGANVNLKDQFGRTPLSALLFGLFSLEKNRGKAKKVFIREIYYSHCISTMKYLISRGADPYILSHDGYRVYDTIKSAPPLQELIPFIEKYVQVKERSPEEKFIDALLEEDLERLEGFLEEGLDINRPDPDGLPPLARAVLGKKERSVKWLLSHHAEVNITMPDEGTLLMWDISDYDFSIWDMLGRYGYDFNGTNKYGKTLLMTCHTISDAYRILNFLIQHKVNLDQQDHIGGNTALHDALFVGNRDGAMQLIRAGADGNISGQMGMTALMSAAAEGWFAGVREIVFHTRTSRLKEHRWDDAILLAADAGHDRVVDFLNKNRE